MAHRRLQKQLPSETRRWIEHSLQALELAQRFEDAYALRMELADWLLEDGTGSGRGNLTVEALLREQHVDEDPLALG
ncbi:MAG: hypothetical protein ACKOCM_12080 [Cyanobacteriota bacterium]